MIRCVILIGVAVIAAAGAGYAIHSEFGHRLDERCRATYPLVNGDVVCGEGDVIRKTGYLETRNAIAELIDARRDEGIDSASVYFRDLVRGPVFGIAELEPFAPASLLKLPLAFVFLAVADDMPEILETNVGYTGETAVNDQRMQPAESAQPGVSYRIRELLRMMLAHSDNASYQTLESYISEAEDRARVRHEVFQELGVIDPKDRLETTLSVRGYASLFRILYNASYLSAAHSQLVLEWLSSSPFKAGIVAGVPEDVAVAHKFGERDRPDGSKELHDCGIVYYPENPYLLCIMTRGTDWDVQTSLIAEISRRVYQEVSSRAL